ncbi:MAG: HesA/MoeB/ThiF family protein [Hyphomicrobiaceae bacterium]|nr:MAG: HesA/MoeB/ThiF family protein [Hyphomicrobiaceae bacterium]
MALTPDEIKRYRRHLVLADVGGQGQQKLKSARALCIGAGGLGSPIVLYLAAAGVGTIGIVDDDKVSLDNLQRQILHETAAVGMAKTESARRTVERLNPHVKIEPHQVRVDALNAMELISRYDLVADGSDNFATRYLLNDACYLARKPLVFGAVGPLDGYVTTFRSYERDINGDPKPNYRCLFPEAPPPGTVQACSEIGVLGAVVGVIGTIMATEVLKEVLGLGEGLSGRLLIYDARSARFDRVSYAWDPGNPLNGRNPTIHDLSEHAKPAEAMCEAAGTTDP